MRQRSRALEPFPKHCIRAEPICGILTFPTRKYAILPFRVIVGYAIEYLVVKATCSQSIVSLAALAESKIGGLT
jgi:hypothetical protein